MIPAIIALAVISIISLIGFYISFKKSQAVNQMLSNKKLIFYYLAFAILISAGGLIALSPTASRSMMYYGLLQVAYAGLGYLAAYLYQKNAPLEMSQGRFAGVFFVLANAFIGMIGFALIYYYFNRTDLAFWFSTCVLPFVLPQFLATSLVTYREIPQEIHKIWYYPLHADEVDYENIDTSNIYMLELEYSKSINDPRLTNTKLRAPVSMKFGDWFRSFIENYNYKYESDPIDYLNPDQTPIGWTFFVKKGALGGMQFIDPELSIADNKLAEKYKIQVKRVGIIAEEDAAY